MKLASKERLSLSLLWRWQYVLRSCSHFHSFFNPRYEHPLLGRAICSVQASTSGINTPNFLKMSKVFRMCSCSNKRVCQLSNMKDRANFQVNRSNVRFLLRLTQNLSKKSFILFWSWSILPPFQGANTPENFSLLTGDARRKRGTATGVQNVGFLGR